MQFRVPMIEQGEFDAKNEIEINEQGFLPTSIFALRFFASNRRLFLLPYFLFPRAVYRGKLTR